MQHFGISTARQTLVFYSVFMLLAGCGGGSVDTGAVGNVSRETTISGSVGDGPIVGGNVLLLSKSGQIISNQSSDSESRYSMKILANDSDFPLMVRVSDGLDLVTGSRPDFPMVAVVMQSGTLNVANLNPFGTIIVKIAEKMDGGISSENLDRATSIVASDFSFGLDVRLVADPIRTPITGANVAAVVKASEVLGEVIRRTRDTLIAVGQSAGAGQILDSLSADLVDGVLDGRGAEGADSRIAATANVVMAQVIIEALTNSLHVGGVDVAQSMDSSIQQIMGGGTGVALTGSITVTAPMLAQARIAADAAFNLLPDAGLLLVRESLDRIQPGATPADAEVMLPAGSSDLLGPAVVSASLATAAELEIVNSTVRQGGGSSVGPNESPSIGGTPPTQVTVSNLYTFTPTATDADGDQLSFAVSGKPAWLGFDPATGTLSGTPGVSDEGIYPAIQIIVSDGLVSAPLAAFAITVNGLPNRAPTIGGTPQTNVTVGALYSFAPTASDPDGDQLSFAVSGKPAWLGFDPVTGTLSGTPGVSDAGIYPALQIIVSDGADSATLAVFSITVAGLPNRAPTISGAAPTQVTVDNLYSFTPTASDPDGDQLSFAVSGKPAWLGFDPVTGTLSGTPGVTDAGVYPAIQIVVSDGIDSATLAAFSITVNGQPNRPPTIGGSAPALVTVGNLYSFTPTASDPDNDPLSFAVSGEPAWLSFDSGSGTLSGTPGAANEGVYPGIQISVSDGAVSTALAAFSITVNGQPNGAPVIGGIPGTSVTVGDAYRFAPTASDPDNDPLSFSISGKPAWLDFDPANGVLSGIPVEADEGVYPGIRISVSDGADSAVLAPFTLTVDGLPNRPPTIAGTPPTDVMVGDSYSFTPTASDPDNDPLSFAIGGKPAWLNFDPATGTLSGTPGAANEGVYPGIQITVSDGADNATLAAFSISVSGLPNRPPTIAGTPPTDVVVGDSYLFTPIASDPDNDPLSFAVGGKPAWLNFDPATGTLSGTPGAANEGVYPGIQITVSDGSDNAMLAAFALTVSGLPNRPPTIAGTPPTDVMVGNSYSFVPTASDPDNDPLSFAVSGKPAWLSFDPATGALSGTPADTDLGVTGAMLITVSDGVESDSLPAFNLTVTPAGTQQLVISNTVPNTYLWGTLAVGSPVYIDRSYTFTEIPPPFQGLDYLVTANDDKSGTSPSALSFDVNLAVTVFVAYDVRASSVPVWLQSWTATGHEFVNTDTTLRIYRMDFPAGAVTLGGNSPGRSMYSVAVIAQGGPLSIDGEPLTSITQGLGYRFVPTAGGGIGLIFSITNQPAWASFDTADGALTGTPGNADVGTTSNIVVSVSDGQEIASLPAFDITVLGSAAGSADLSWIAPTQNVDGTTLTDLAGFKIHYGPAVDDYPNVATINNPTVTTHLVENLSPGTWVFVVTAFDSNDNESEFSDFAVKVVAP